MPTDLFDLAARITADTSQHDKALTESQKKVLALAAEHKALDATISSSSKSIGANLGNAASQANKFSNSTLAMRAAVRSFGAEAASVLPGPLGNMARQLIYVASSGGAVEGAFGGMLGPIALVAGGMAVAGAATVGAAAAIFDFTKKAAEAGNQIFSLQEKTNLSAETLSALQVLAEQSNTSIERLTAGLGIFDKKIEEAAQNTKSKMSHELQQLGITSTNTEIALRQGLETLSKMTNSTQQVAVAMQLFGRSGKEVLAILKNSDGDFNAAIKNLQDMGLIMSGADTLAAHEFEQNLVLLEHQLTVTSMKIANELYPTIEGFLSSLDKFLADNRSTFEEWGRGIANVIEGIKQRWDELAVLLANPIIGQVYIVAKWLGFGGGESPAMGPTQINVPGAGTSQVPAGVDPVVAAQWAATTGLPTSLPGENALANRLKLGGAGGGRGRGGGAKQIDEVTQALEKQKQEIEEAFKGADQYQKEIDRLIFSEQKHKRVIDDKRMSQLLANAEQLRSIETNKIATDFMRELKDKLNETGVVTDKYDDEIKNVNKTLAKYHTTLTDVIGKEGEDVIAKLRQIDALEKEAEAMQQLNITRQRYADILKNTRPRTAGVPENPSFPIIDLGGGSVFGVPTQTPTIEEILTGTRQRRTQADPFKDQWDKVRQQAGAITELLSKSIEDGFSKGVKAGAIEFAQGIVQMIESKMLNKLADAITDAIMAGFGNAKGSGGGSGPLGFLAKFIIPIFGGAALGGVTGLGGSLSGVSAGIGGSHAMGLPFVPFDNYPALLHKGERVLTAAENARGAGAVHNHYWNITTQDARSFMSEDTQRQMTQRATRIMQHAALTG